MMGSRRNKTAKKSGRQGRYSDEIREELNTNFTRGATLATYHVEREKTDRQKERDLRASRRKLSSILLIILLICGLGLLALTQFSGSITSVSSNAPTLQNADTAKYQKIVGEYMSKNPFERFQFARRNNNLTNYLATQAPEVKTASIEQTGLLQGKLRLEFREPVAMWTVAGQTNYVDAEGVVFARNYFGMPAVTITDNSGAAGSGNAVASSRLLKFVGQVTAELKKNNGGVVDRVVIPTGAIRYAEFYLTNRQYPFKAQIDRVAASQAADIAAMTRYLDANHLTPSYVDVRVAGKGFWK